MINIVIQLIFLITLSEAIAQYCLRSAHNQTCINNKCIGLVILGMLAYCTVGILLYKVYSFENIGVTNLIWSCLSIIAAFVVGKFFFNEQIKKHDVIAFFLAISAIIFASLN